MSIIIPNKYLPPSFKPSECRKCPLKTYVMTNTDVKIRCPFFAYLVDMDCNNKVCPLKELPPHGRLIDADVLYNKIIQNIKDIDEDDEDYDAMRTTYQSMLFELDNETPTILEASKED